MSNLTSKRQFTLQQNLWLANEFEVSPDETFSEEELFVQEVQPDVCCAQVSRQPHATPMLCH